MVTRKEKETAKQDFRFHIQKAMYNFILAGLSGSDMIHEEDNDHYRIEIIKGKSKKYDI